MKILQIYRLLGCLALLIAAPLRLVAAPVVTREEFVEKHCASCHDEEEKTAGWI